MARRRWIEHDGRCLTLRGWALEAGIAPGTLWDRLERRHLPMARLNEIRSGPAREGEPMTKPAGVFLQIVGGCLFFSGMGLLVSDPIIGCLLLLLAVRLISWGRRPAGA
jgi:hypothetical protein